VTTVSCIGCDARLPLARADIAATGYRCARCSLLAQIDATNCRTEPRPHTWLIAGVVLTVIAMLMWRAGWDVDLGDAEEPSSLFVLVAFGAIACTSLGYFGWRDRTWASTRRSSCPIWRRHPATDAQGRLRCVVCHGLLSLGSADIVGLGYRCRACSLRAQLDGNDEAAHLTADERAHVYREPRPRAFLFGGLGMLALATVLWLAHFDLPITRFGSLFVWLFVVGVGLTGTGLIRWRDR
jgi:DNA-directed RNA polymerase subunit RPC12/RpoP